MEEYEKLVESVNDIANIITGLEPKAQQEMLSDNMEILQSFNDNLDVILRVYQFKEKDNTSQNQVSDKLKNVILMILNQREFFETQPKYQYFLSELLDKLSFNENKFAVRLQYENNMHNAQYAIEYMQNRSEFIESLGKSKDIQINDMNRASISSYLDNKYEENMLGHALILIKKNFLSLEREDILKILNCIDHSGFFDELIQKDHEQMNFYDKNLIFQYTDTILNLKSIFTPETINTDIFVQSMWNGEINDSKMIQSIIKNISVNCVENIWNLTNKDFSLIEIANHFKDVGYSDKQIAMIINEIVSKGIITYDIAKVLAEIDVPQNFETFRDSEYAQKYPWLLEESVFETLKKEEGKIDDARNPYLPAEYYIKKIDSNPEINKQVVRNLIVLLSSNYYTEKEKAELKETLKKNNFYNIYMTDEEIIFEQDDSFDTKVDKMLEMYFSGKVIPMDVAISTLNIIIDVTSQKNNEKVNKLLKMITEICVQSVISNVLDKKDVDIGNRVFFGNGHEKTLGYYNSTNKYIWIDENMIEKFVNSQDWKEKKELFILLFHEMQHAIQHYNIENGKADFLTYNFLKESIIAENDEKYYDENYWSFYEESDARREGILGALEFIKELNPEFVKIIREEVELDYIKETRLHTIYGDSKKKMNVGEKKVKVDVSKYIGLMIQANPQILMKNPILAIEYNSDGSQKAIETLLKEFSEKKNESNLDYSNIYSIYYGIITEQLKHFEVQDPQLQEQLTLFLQEQPEMISLEDMQLLYEKVPTDKINEVYHRLIYLTRGRRTMCSTSVGGETHGDGRR